MAVRAREWSSHRRDLRSLLAGGDDRQDAHVIRTTSRSTEAREGHMGPWQYGEQEITFGSGKKWEMRKGVLELRVWFKQDKGEKPSQQRNFMSKEMFRGEKCMQRTIAQPSGYRAGER